MAITRKQREVVYKKTSGKCAYCGGEIKLKDMQVDHIIPQMRFSVDIRNKYKIPSFLIHLTENDVNHIDNLHPSCRVCNKWKSANDLELFRSEIEAQTDRLKKYSAQYRLALKYGLLYESIDTKITFYFETLEK